MQSDSRSPPGSGNGEGNNSQPWLDGPLTEAPIESVEPSHNEPSPRLPPALLPLVTHSLPSVSPALSSLSIEGQLAQFGETGPIDPREPQPSPNPLADRWYRPGPWFGALYDFMPSVGLPTSALGLRLSPQDTSFSMLQRTPQSSLSTDRSILASRSSSIPANPTFGAHWCLTLPGRRGLRSFGIYPSERIAQSAPHRTN